MKCTHRITTINSKPNCFLGVRKCTTITQSFDRKRNSWSIIDNQKQLLESLGNKIGIRSLDDWYNIPAKELLKDPQAKYVLKKFYHGSLYNALRELYPSTQWCAWKFISGVPNGFWTEQENVKLFIHWVASEHKIQNLDDWYNLDCKEIGNLGGAWLLRGRSLPEIVQSVYPHHTWYFWKFRSGIPHGYWKDLKNQKHFFDWVAQQLNIASYQDWYNVTIDQIVKLGGHELLALHGTSLAAALEAVYPEQNWEAWKFVGGTPKRYWKDEANIRKFFHKLLEHYGLVESEIALLTYENVRAFGGSALLRRNGGLDVVLKKYFPHVRLKEVPSKGQLLLYKLVGKIFPNQTLLMNHKLSYHGLTSPLEIDVFVPHLNLGFEYQGEYHYQWNYLYGSPTQVQSRDSQKKKACDDLKITLIEIPFWWDRRLPSLVATIQQCKPGVVPSQLLSSEQPISQDIPANILKRIQQANTKRQALQAT